MQQPRHGCNHGCTLTPPTASTHNGRNTRLPTTLACCSLSFHCSSLMPREVTMSCVNVRATCLRFDSEKQSIQPARCVCGGSQRCASAWLEQGRHAQQLPDCSSSTHHGQRNRWPKTYATHVAVIKKWNRCKQLASTASAQRAPWDCAPSSGPVMTNGLMASSAQRKATAEHWKGDEQRHGVCGLVCT